MRSNKLISRNCNDLKKSKAKIITNLTTQITNMPMIGSFPDWRGVTDLFRQAFKINLNEPGSKTEWVSHLGPAQIDPPVRVKNEERFVISFAAIQLKNQLNQSVDIPGELKITFIKTEANTISLEKVETNSRILDAVMMDQKLELLGLIKRHFSESKDISVYEEAIQKELKKTEISHPKKIALSGLLAAIGALKVPNLDAANKQAIETLLYAAWELYHEPSDNFDAGLEIYSVILQDLIRTDVKESIKVILHRLGEEMSPCCELAEIDSNLMTKLRSLNINQFSRLNDPSISTRVNELIEETRPNLDLRNKNPKGLLYEKSLRLQANRAVINSYLKEEKKSLIADAIDAELATAIAEVNASLYFKQDSSGNSLLNSIENILPHSPTARRQSSNIHEVIENGKNELMRESQQAKWQQTFRRFFQPLRHQQAKLKKSLKAVLENAGLSLDEKFSKIDELTQGALEKSKPRAWAFWRAPANKAEFEIICNQTKALSSLSAFLQSKIDETKLIEDLKKSGQLAFLVAEKFERAFANNVAAGKMYRKETAELRWQEFQEPVHAINTTAKLPTAQKTALLQVEKAGLESTATPQIESAPSLPRSPKAPVNFGNQQHVIYAEYQKRTAVLAGTAQVAARTSVMEDGAQSSVLVRK